MLHINYAKLYYKLLLRQGLQPLYVNVYVFMCILVYVCVLFMRVLLFTCYNAAISAK